jgi:hypothetical protein
VTRAELLHLADEAAVAQHAATAATNTFFQALVDMGNFRAVTSGHVFADPDVIERIAEIEGAARNTAGPMKGALEVVRLIARTGGPDGDRVLAAIESGERHAAERCPCATCTCTTRRREVAAATAQTLDASSAAARSPR